jgi:hypothetical protein
MLLLAGLGASVVSCKRTGTVTDDKASPVTATDDASPAEAKAAATWLEALRAKSANAVAHAARAPFDFHDARQGAPRAKCGDVAHADAKGVDALAACLVTDEILSADLAANPAPRIVATTKELLPAWAKPWAGDVRPGLRPMSVFIHGPSSSFEMILLVADDGVHAFWQTLFVDPS